ncbi:hypothetical protein FB45DRAFT_761043 [Roridomyces roridus]|uniref:F-box domain-containing protein n=1 Tax=Roridomyces roridus TaxID=1738132 RepID=A0AAD7B4X2_9AGAR|nr:hypothetical protein FB45DRAFT_761043 [Roridomyces roridus]
MPSSISLAAYLPNFLLSHFQKAPKCHIQRLPFDIFVDQIFVYLTIEDIMCLRRVDRTFFLLTHEPVIWKRFLERMRTPIPPLRPTFRYSLQVTDFEAEQLVSRAISLDDNWRRDEPRIKARKVMESHHRVLDMKLLPGGKFLIASVRDLSSYRYYITLFSLDHPRGNRAVARMPTISKAYDLQAKYMKYNGKHGIMVAYTRRTFKGGERSGFDPSDYCDTDAVDPPFPFIYESVCLHVSLDDLEELVDPRIIPGSAQFYELAVARPPPFLQLSHFESETRITSLTLFELNKKAHVAFVQQPRGIVFIDLVSGVVLPMQIHNYNNLPDEAHQIRTMRVLPDQNDVILIRTVVSETSGHTATEHLTEMFHIPTDELPDNTVQPFERWPVDPRSYESFYFSDPVTASIGIDHPNIQPATGAPSPISLFCRTIAPVGLVHYLIWPRIEEQPDQPPKYFFNLEFVVPQTVHVSAPHAMRVLAGSSKALVYTIDSERKHSPRMLSMRRYLSPQLQPLWSLRGTEDPTEPISRRDRPAMSKKYYSAFNLPRYLRRKLDDEGVSAITWDESIGRLCLACGDEFKIHILDFASAVTPDSRFKQWQLTQQIKLNVPGDPGLGGGYGTAAESDAVMDVDSDN